MEQKRHIMIVDDEQLMLNSLDFILMSGGYETSVARNGQEALDTIHALAQQGTPVDLLITDIQMPEITGIQLIQVLRREGSALPVLAITGYGEKEMVVELLRQGVKDFRDKPFEPEELLAQVNQLFVRMEQERTTEQARLHRLEEEKAELERRIEGYLTDIDQLKAKIGAAFGQELPDEIAADQQGYYRVSTQNGHLLVTPQGDMREGTAMDLRTLLINLLDKGNSAFRFDLRQVKVIDAVNFSVLLVFAKTLLKQGREGLLEISGASREVRNLFRLTHMDEAYRFID